MMFKIAFLLFHFSLSSAHDHHHKLFKDAQAWSKEFDDPKRDEWQKPEQVLEWLKLQPTDKVADLGAGTGYFAVRLAPKVPNGLVYAIDMQPEMVEFLKKRAEKEGLKQIKPLLAKETGFEGTDPLDVVLIVDTYHHIGSRTDYFKTLGKKMKEQGRLVIIDFLKTSPLGPPAKHRYQPPQIEAELKPAGFKLVQQQKLPYQFYVEFIKSQDK